MKCVSMIFAAVALLSGVAWAGDVSEAQARSVAANFAKGDSALKSRTVDNVTKRGNLWIVSLRPAGYIAVSANDAAYPIAVFASANFVEPPAGSTAAAILRRLDADVGSAQGEAYRAVWNRLLGAVGESSPSLRSATAPVVDTEAEVRVSVPTAWQQCQPFNDFMPIEYASGNSINTIYRGRRFLGCVPTAYVQIMNYWQWPEVIDADTGETLNIPAEKYDGVNPITSYTPRIKSGTAMEWDGTQSQYPLDVSSSSGVSSGVYDLRGYFSEKKRQCIGRACLLSQIISKASLMTTGTGATLAQPAYNDWYEAPSSIGHGSSGGTDGTDPDWFFGEVKKLFKAGIPALVGIDVQSSDGWTGHAVVGTGWKYENDSHWFELNYGWGGGSAYHSYETIKAHLGSVIYQRPKPKPVLVNQPDSAALPLSLSWHFPKKGWEHVLTGFKVLASEYGMTLADKTDTFDANPGTASGENPASIFTGLYDSIGNDTAVLIVKPEGAYGKKTYYTWNDPKTLSDDSALSFRLRANDTRGIEVILQANIDGAGWNDVYTFPRSDNAIMDWTTVKIPLATGNAGKSMRLRLLVEKIASANGQWQDSKPIGYMIDDFTVTDVESIGVENPVEIASLDDPAARSVTIAEGLNVGTRYALMVRPVFSEGSALDSDYVPIMVVASALAAPEFASVTRVAKNTSAPNVAEDCFRECALGRNYLAVQGSATMTGLKAYSSHTAILPDAKISVDAVPNHAGRYLVSIDASGIPALGGRQRVILTLVGSNACGAKVQKDMTLRFSAETGEEPVTVAADLEEGGDAPEENDDDPAAEPDDPDEPEEEAPVVTPTFPKAVNAGPNDDAEAMTRFCPGVTAASGWHDVNKTGTTAYVGPGAVNLARWWAARYELATGSAPNGYAAIADADVSSSYSIQYLDYLKNTVLKNCTDVAAYFPEQTTAAADWAASATDTKVVAAGRRIFAALANGPIGFSASYTSTYYGVIWGCKYATDATGSYATEIYFTCSKSKNDGLEQIALATGDYYNETADGSIMLKKYAGTYNAIVDFFYPVSAPEPTSSGEGEVTVKVTAGGQEFDISKAFSKVEKGAGNVITYTLDPTPGKTVQIGDEQISIQPEFAEDGGEVPFEVQDGQLVFKVKSIPGLKYQVLMADSLDDGTFEPVGQAREATGPRRELTVGRSGETRGFYKIQVSR